MRGLHRRPQAVVIYIGRYTIPLLFVSVLMGFLLIYKASAVLMAVRSLDLSQKSVVIDPGHGGIDGGTHDGEGLLQKDLNLEVALLLKAYLESKSMRVAMTREKDMSLEEYSDLGGSRYRRDLAARRKLINQSGADVLVSIHVNSRPNRPDSRGVEVFYHPKAEEGMKLAASLSQAIDRIVFRSFLEADRLRIRILPGNFFVLREAAMPGSLVEMGFITNPEDKKLLQDPDYQKAMAFAIGVGIIDYLRKSAIAGQTMGPLRRPFGKLLRNR